MYDSHGDLLRPADKTRLGDISTQREQTDRAVCHYGCQLGSLSGRRTPDGQLHRAEMLSPLLSGLEADESLAFEVALGPGGHDAVVAIRGTAEGNTTADSRQRADELMGRLMALTTTQFPGFSLRPLKEIGSRLEDLAHSALISPHGRPIASMRQRKSELGPVEVGSEATELLLPHLRFSPEGLTAAVELLKARCEPAKISLTVALTRFDARQLRILKQARHDALSNEPRTQVEAMRQFFETVPDDVLMTELINDAGGVQLGLELQTKSPLDEADRSMLGHAVFGTEAADGLPDTALNLSDVYPRNFALGRAVVGFSTLSERLLRRTPQCYEPPAVQGAELGTTRDGRAVTITQTDRAMHQFVVGATGTGKSTLMLNQIAADMEAGRGLLVLDPHGDLWEAARKLVPERRRKDLVLIHLGEPDIKWSMNVLSALGGDPAIERSATVNGLLRLFKNSLWPGLPEAFGPMFELYFRNALLLLMEAEGDKATILDFERVFHDDDYRSQLIELCQTQHVKDFWRKTVARISHHEISLENITPYIICKFAPFTTNTVLKPILGTKASTLDLREAIAKRKIVLVNLAKGTVGEGSARLVGSLFTMRLVAAAQTQMRLPEQQRQEFFAYLDEFQTYATEHVAEAIEETRKYKLRLILACQSLSQIDGRGPRPDVVGSVLANVANLISFRLGVDDARTLAHWFEPNFSAEDLMYLPNHDAIGRLLVDGQAIRPIEFQTAPPPRNGADAISRARQNLYDVIDARRAEKCNF